MRTKNNEYTIIQKIAQNLISSGAGAGEAWEFVGAAYRAANGDEQTTRRAAAKFGLKVEARTKAEKLNESRARVERANRQKEYRAPRRLSPLREPSPTNESKVTPWHSNNQNTRPTLTDNAAPGWSELVELIEGDGLEKMTRHILRKKIALIEGRGARVFDQHKARPSVAAAMLASSQDSAQRLAARVRDDKNLIEDCMGAVKECFLIALSKNINPFTIDKKISRATWAACAKKLNTITYRATGRGGREVIETGDNINKMIEQSGEPCAALEMARGWSPPNPLKSTIKLEAVQQRMIDNAKKARAKLRQHWEQSKLNGEKMRQDRLKKDLVSVRDALVLAIDPKRAKDGHNTNTASTNRSQLHRLKKRIGIKNNLNEL